MVIFNSYVKLPEGNLKQFMHDWDWTTWQQFCGNWKSSVQRERTGKYQQFLEKTLGSQLFFINMTLKSVSASEFEWTLKTSLLSLTLAAQLP